VERLLDVDLPGAAERVPRVLVQRPRQRVGPGVEHHDPRPVLVDELACDDRVGRVRCDRHEPIPMPGLLLGARSAAPGHADHPNAGLGQGGADGAAEAPAGARDHRCHAGDVVLGHVVPPSPMCSLTSIANRDRHEGGKSSRPAELARPTRRAGGGTGETVGGDILDAAEGVTIRPLEQADAVRHRHRRQRPR
jgi:hypothetical protein